MKRIIALSLSAIMAFSLNINRIQGETIVYDGQEQDYKNTNIGIRIEGDLVEYEGMYPVVLNNRTLVPVREIMESPNINASVEWNGETKTVVIKKDDKTVTLKEGDLKGYVNGVELPLDSEVKLMKDNDIGVYKLMVPMRFISESFGYDVRWDKDSQEVVLTNVDQARKAMLLDESNVTKLMSASDIKTLPTKLSTQPIRVEVKNQESFVKLEDGVNQASYSDATISEIVGNDLESKFYIQTSSPVSTLEYSVTDEKLIIDVDGLIMNDFPTSIRMDDGIYVSAIRSNQTTSSPYKARIVFDLHEGCIPKGINFSEDRSSIEVTFNEKGLNKIDISQDSTGDLITLDGNYSDYSAFRLSQPNALVFDLYNSNNLLGDKNILGVNGQAVDNIYVGTIDKKITRLIIEGKQSNDYELTYNESLNKTTIRLKPLDFSLISFNYESFPTLVIPKTSTLVNYDINKITIKNSELGFVTKIAFNQTITEVNKNQKFYIGDKHTDHVELLSYDGNTSIIFTNRHIIEYQITEDENNLYIKGIRPKDLYGTMVLLDAGHGGYQPGAAYNGIIEKDVNLKLMNYIREYTELRKDIKYYYTRIDDTASSLNDRIAIANDLEVDLLLSMHNNAIDIKNNPLLTEVRGMEVLTTIDKQTSADEVRLAKSVFTNMAAELPELSLRSIKDYNNLYLLKYSDMPAIIIEYGYLTNPEDAKNLKEEWILKEAARITEATIYEYFKK